MAFPASWDVLEISRLAGEALAMFRVLLVIRAGQKSGVSVTNEYEELITARLSSAGPNHEGCSPGCGSVLQGIAGFALGGIRPAATA